MDALLIIRHPADCKTFYDVFSCSNAQKNDLSLQRVMRRLILSAWHDRQRTIGSEGMGVFHLHESYIQAARVHEWLNAMCAAAAAFGGWSEPWVRRSRPRPGVLNQRCILKSPRKLAAVQLAASCCSSSCST